jgi:hypothetical protein
MLISEMLIEIREELPKQLSLLYKARASTKNDWRLEELNAHRQKLIDEYERMARDYGLENCIE